MSVEPATAPSPPIALAGIATRVVPASVERARVSAFATAIGEQDDPSRRAIPPLFAAVVLWDVTSELAAAVASRTGAALVIHEAQDLWLHRPLELDEALLTRGRIHGVVNTPRGAAVTLKLWAWASNQPERPVIESFMTLLIRGANTYEIPRSRPDHRMPLPDETRLLGGFRIDVDRDQAVRYAVASGDANPIHLDPLAARAAGFPGVILHGLCTLALATGTVVRALGTTPTDVGRVSGRFVRAVRPGQSLVVSTYRLEGAPTGVGFEVTNGRRPVVKDGRVEIRI